MTIIPPALQPPAPPPLVDGSLLTRAEFERRYEAMPEVKKAELIEGVVFMGSPVSWGSHAETHGDMVWLLKHYSYFTPGVTAGDNGSLRLDDENVFQPDVTLIIRPDHGGRVRLDGYLEGAPDLVAEVASSSLSIDLNQKFRVYQRNQVREYLVHRVRDEAIDWFIYRGTKFERLEPGADGVSRSEAFPGLWLDVAAFLRLDIVTVLNTLNLGLASPEHAAFVAQLAANGPQP